MQVIKVVLFSKQSIQSDRSTFARQGKEKEKVER